MPLSPSDRDELGLKLRQVFKPTTPVNSYDLFCGRKSQIHSLLAAVNQNGQHAILFGERGVGKTSLANILFYLIESPGWPKLTPHTNCTRGDTYGSLWGRVFVDILEQGEKEGIEFPKRVRQVLRLAQEGYSENITMDVVRTTLTKIGGTALLVVILDEFDTLGSGEVRAGVADTIKYLSDRNAPCTLVVVGVANDVEGLISDHRSVERCLAQVRMPRMSRDELEDVVRRHLSMVGMTIVEPAMQEISRIAAGLPHYAHLLGLHSAVVAVGNGATKVTEQHVSRALSAATEDALQHIQQGYMKATESSQNNALYEHVLIACAMTETNELGYFAPADVRDPLTRILKKPARIENFNRHLHAFCEEDSGPVLEKITIRGRPKYRFATALMQPFAVMKGLAQGIITEEDLRATRDPDDPQMRMF